MHNPKSRDCLSLAGGLRADKSIRFLKQQHRYNAASCAALTAAGQGEDARFLPDKVVVMFRRWAIKWLRDDLNAYSLRAPQDNPTGKREIQQKLLRWRHDFDLASVREPETLNRLPHNERAAWQSLGRDADELAKQVANKIKPETKVDKKP